MSFTTTQKFLADNYGVTMQQVLDFVAANVASPQTIFNVCKQASVTNQMLADIISPVAPSATKAIVAQYFFSNNLDAALLDLPENSNGTVTAVTINIQGPGQSTDSAQINTSYVIGLNGEYQYTIKDFAAGDKLIFPKANLATVINSDFTDGQVIVNYASAGQVTAITLTGIPETIDANIFGPISFRGIFGSDALN